MPYKRQAPITKMLHALFTQSIPAYAAYKTEQKKEKEKKKEKERELKERRMKAELDFYTAMTKDRDPIIRGMSVEKLEELLGKTPYSVVAGQEKLRPAGMPQRATLQPGRMPMGPMAGGVMTTRPPALSEMIKGAEPSREHKYPYTEAEVKGLKTFEARLKGQSLTQYKAYIAQQLMKIKKGEIKGVDPEVVSFMEKVLFSPNLMEQLFMGMFGGQMPADENARDPLGILEK